MQLSRFFTLAEMTRSDTAAREGIANTPDPAATDRLRELCSRVLDPLREAVGQPIKVNSGYRGPALNKRIGGATNSQHVEGKATDIQCASMPVLQLFQTIIRMGLPFDQLIYEAKSAAAKWVHVSHSAAGNRGQIMVAEFDSSGKPIAYPRITAEAALAMSEPAMAGRGPRELEYIETGDEPMPARRPAKRPPKAGKKTVKKVAGKTAGKPAKKAAPRATRPGRKDAVRKAASSGKKKPVRQAKRSTAGAGAAKVARRPAPSKTAGASRATARKRAATAKPKKKQATSVRRSKS